MNATREWAESIKQCSRSQSLSAYILNTPEDVAAMLARIGVKTVGDLFANIPPELRFQRALDIPPALSEIELHERLHPDETATPCRLGPSSSLSACVWAPLSSSGVTAG